MNKTFILAALAFVALAGSASADPILVGSPTTAVVSDGAGITSYYTDVAGSHVTTTTSDDTGMADVDLYFYDAAGNYLDGCANDGEEDCDVPVGAAEVEVAAFLGANIEVELTWS